MRINNGWLEKEDGIEAVLDKNGKPTSNYYSLSYEKPLMIVWHYTSAKWYNLQNSKQVCETLLGRKTGASWHLTIDKDGKIYQNISFLKGAWGVVGKCTLNGKEEVINKVAVHIELENEGRVKKIGNNFYTWPWKENKILEVDSPVYKISSGEFQGALFTTFTNEQKRAAESLLIAIKSEYKISIDNCLRTHHEFDPKRKDDPGPIWEDWLKSIKTELK